MDNRIMRVSASGGNPTLVVPIPPSGEGVGFPSFLPDGRHFLYLRNGSGKAEVSGIYVGALDVKPEQQSAQRLMEGGSQPLYALSSDSKSGYILILRQGTLMAQPFDPARLQLQGEPIPVVEQVASLNSLGHYSVSDSGALAYRTGTTRGIDMQLSWFDRAGKATLTAAEPSPDGAAHVGNIVLAVGRPTNEGPMASFGVIGAIVVGIWQRIGLANVKLESERMARAIQGCEGRCKATEDRLWLMQEQLRECERKAARWQTRAEYLGWSDQPQNTPQKRDPA